MIARELTEFFAGFSPDGAPVVHRRGDLAFLSNVNACYARACWEEVRFPDVAYAEDQAFGRAMLEAGWAKVFTRAPPSGTPTTTARSSSCGATSTSTAGLRETIGHVEPLPARAGVRDRCARPTALDARARLAGRRPRSLARALGVSPLGRRAVPALGSRADRPARRRSASALAGGARTAPRRRDERPASRSSGGTTVGGGPALSRDGPAPLDDPVPGWRSASGSTSRS